MRGFKEHGAAALFCRAVFATIIVFTIITPATVTANAIRQPPGTRCAPSVATDVNTVCQERATRPRTVPGHQTTTQTAQRRLARRSGVGPRQ